MNHTKAFQKLTFTAALLGLCALPATLRAQDPPPSTTQSQQAGPGPGRHENEMANLNLTDDQKTQIKKIHEDAKTQMEAARNDSTLTADQKKAKMQEIHKSTHEQVMQVLTPEQRQQMKSDEMARKAAKNGQAPPQQ
jgi:Spy/CpxP family protein refolding chaperone